MFELFALLDYSQIWWAFPLVIAYSLVYAATRHEETVPIFRHAGALMVNLFIFLAIVYAVVYFAV